MTKRKSAREKLKGTGAREIVDMPPMWASRYGPGKLLIPLPTDIDSEIRKIPPGQVKEIAQIRSDLAAKFGAAATCPLVSGIFWRLVAEAAEEDRAEGKTDISPYWRVIKEKGKLNEKLPGGIEGHAAFLRAEGVPMTRQRNGAPQVAVNSL